MNPPSKEPSVSFVPEPNRSIASVSSAGSGRRVGRRRSTLGLPFAQSKGPQDQAREADKLSNTAATFLERGVHSQKSVAFLDNHEGNKETVACSRWIYHVMLILLMIVVIILCGASATLELFAFLDDLAWNGILSEKRAFPSVSSKDVIFAGKKLRHVAQVFPAAANYTNLKKYLHRDQSLETGVIVLILAVFLYAAVQLVIFVACSVSEWRKRLIAAFIGFGVLGVVLFVAGVILTMSTIVFIPDGFVHIRTQIEDVNVSAGGMVPHHRPHHYKKVNPDWPVVTNNCQVLDSMEDAAELQRLLDIVKLCVYGRYVAMNFQDPCRHVKLAEKIAIPGARKEYTLKDFEKLKICPMDFYKILAIILIFGGAGCCWIIMWMGSYASKVLFPHSNLHDSLLYKPGAVYAISDLSYRDETDVPPEMRIVSPGLWNPHPHPHPPPHTDGGSGPIAAAGGSGTSTGSPTPSIPSTTMANIRTKLLAVHRLMPVGTVNRKASNHGLLETMSIMNIAPNMVIRPPAGASTGVTTTTTPTRASTTTNTTAQTDQASTWFHSINDDM